NVFPLWLPALRQRASDIPLLANYFLTKVQRHIGRQSPGFTPESLEKMMAYSWPGNVRELYNIIERSLILHSGHGLLSVQLETEIGFPVQDNGKTTKATSPQVSTCAISSLADAEKQHILSALAHCQGKVSGKQGAAEVLQLPVSTLRSRMKKLGIQN
ncbi:MAG: Fis family transcriptional regulator, partial [Oleispira sp.]|nr:Fis family transcriptional regulator [Oleispira sp.]